MQLNEIITLLNAGYTKAEIASFVQNPTIAPQQVVQNPTIMPQQVVQNPVTLTPQQVVQNPTIMPQQVVQNPVTPQQNPELETLKRENDYLRSQVTVLQNLNLKMAGTGTFTSPENGEDVLAKQILNGGK